MLPSLPSSLRSSVSRLLRSSHAAASFPHSNPMNSDLTSPVGNPMAQKAYEDGRRKALEFAKKEGFVAVVESPVIWNDMDANAHVNNVVYFRWLESGRLCYMRELTHSLPPSVADDLNGSGKGKGVILGRIGFDYKRTTFYPDSVLIMHRPREFNNRKMVLESAVYSYTQQALVGRGDAVMKAFDYDQQASTEFPPEVLEELEKAGAKRIEGGGGGKAKL